jgi:hypothetical protein
MCIVTCVACTHTRACTHAHTQFRLPSLLPGPSLLTNVSWCTSPTTAVCPDNQQPVFNLSNLSVIEMFQLCCKVSAMDLPGTLYWSLLVFYVVVFSTASCTMQGNCCCFVGVLFTHNTWTVQLLVTSEQFQQCGYRHLLTISYIHFHMWDSIKPCKHLFCVCVCTFSCLLHASMLFCYLSAAELQLTNAGPITK